ncbi:hypothetical protein E1263_10355 [Kribbella antibiotica]|uniref:Uncharacterized protein n=1 Tax=Kribbella antibiotica TaxID=190195 RepID=A0A4R4ZP40_9ACTN|nr:hypothetical protein [Kribbella antibiotica]TDD60668.1 hypothetical protein E1263_10355 [Kribbella antibiotica]
MTSMSVDEAVPGIIQRIVAWFRRLRQPVADLEIDRQKPALFEAYPSCPDPAGLVLEIRDRVDELYAHGAIDEGTPRVLEDRVELVRDQWQRQIALEHLERRRKYGHELAERQGRLDRTNARIEQLESRLKDVELAMQAEQTEGRP